ncbi:PAE domain-containing protein [Cephalotus follicularis]|uniref:Pectin acetylesterase n=1 Tax=Cephalotus follicularis TaxID=3775 RepID=A0A1Q3D2L2_CEPFO|nr:PAE domain-containing protein [Cephalotus follicularis]
MVDAKCGQRLNFLACVLLLPKAEGGSMEQWLAHIEGGAWWEDAKACLLCKKTSLGSSLTMDKEIGFSRVLSSKVKYCDGEPFSGDVEAVDHATRLYIRGARVFRAIIDDILAKEMSNAQNAILSGCSTGGLASILHYDSLRSILLEIASVTFFADAYYILFMGLILMEGKVLKPSLVMWLTTYIRKLFACILHFKNVTIVVFLPTLCDTEDANTKFYYECRFWRQPIQATMASTSLQP